MCNSTVDENAAPFHTGGKQVPLQGAVRVAVDGSASVGLCWEVSFSSSNQTFKSQNGTQAGPPLSSSRKMPHCQLPDSSLIVKWLYSSTAFVS